MALTTVRTVATGDPAPTAAEINAIQANFTAGIPDQMTTKGDLILATAANTAARLAVGANLSYIVAASGETTGAKWGHNAAARAINSPTVFPDKMQFAAEDFDVFGKFTIAGDTDWYTPTVTGYYFVSVYFETSAADAPSVNDYFIVRLYSSGPVIHGHLAEIYAQSTTDIEAVSCSGSGIFYLTGAEREAQIAVHRLSALEA